MNFPRSLHMIGIGGIGMSALAQLLVSRGSSVSGFDAVKEILALANPYDTILFSPAFASPGMFKNEHDCNDQRAIASN